MNQEIDAHEIDTHKVNTAEQQQPARRASPQPGKRSKTSSRDTRTDRSVQKEVAALEKTIARLEGQRANTNQQLLAATDPAEALRLHHELVSLNGKLEAAEERWFRLQD